MNPWGKDGLHFPLSWPFHPMECRFPSLPWVLPTSYLLQTQKAGNGAERHQAAGYRWVIDIVKQQPESCEQYYGITATCWLSQSIVSSSFPCPFSQHSSITSHSEEESLPGCLLFLCIQGPFNMLSLSSESSAEVSGSHITNSHTALWY